MKVIISMIKKYFIAVYSAHYFWSSFDKKYNLAKDTVVGHITGLLGYLFILITSVLHRLNIIKFEGDLKEYRLYLLIIIGLIGYILIIRPLDKYIKKNISLSEVEKEFQKGKFTKKNTLKYFLWNIFGFLFLLIALSLTIKYILYPIIDFLSK